MEKAFDLEKDLHKAEKQYGLGGGKSFFTFEHGLNQVRILSGWEPLATHFFGKGSKEKPAICYGVDEGCPYHADQAPLNDNGEPQAPTVKFVAYILDRKDEQIKLIKLPYSIVKTIVKYGKDPDYTFGGFPMPYDLKITYNPDAAPIEMYSMIPSPKREPVSEETMQELAKKKDVIDWVEEQKLKAKEEYEK